MQPKIIVKEQFHVIGMSCHTTLKQNNIPKLWEIFVSCIDKITNRVSSNVAMVTFGVCEKFPDLAATSEPDFIGNIQFTYIACVEVNNHNNIPEGMIAKTIPSNKYAVFTHKGKMDTLIDTYNYIFGVWLPNSGYTLADADDFEMYDERFGGKDSENSEFDIYIPIK